jgi:hypothetical protein
VTRWHPLTKVHEVDGYGWLSPRLIRSWLYQGGGLPHSKFHGVVLIDLDALDQLIESGRCDATSTNTDATDHTESETR